jgi:hypothetical protein
MQAQQQGVEHDVVAAGPGLDVDLGQLMQRATIPILNPERATRQGQYG